MIEKLAYSYRMPRGRSEPPYGEQTLSKQLSEFARCSGATRKACSQNYYDPSQIVKGA